MLSKSIRWQLQLWLAFLLVCVLSGFGFTVYQLEHVSHFRALDEELTRRVELLSSELRGNQRRPGGGGPPMFFNDGPHGPGPRNSHNDFRNDTPPEPPDNFSDGPPSERNDHFPGNRRNLELTDSTKAIFADTGAGAFYFVAWSWSGSSLGSSPNAPASTRQPSKADKSLIRFQNHGSFREAYHFTEMGDCILVGRSIAADLKELSNLRWLLSAAGGGILAIGLGIGFWLTGRAIRPLEEISAAAGRISAGNLAERIRTSNPENEIGRLAGVLNSTFERLQQSFERQKQFTGDASHELRTPLAVLINEAQTALARQRSADDYRETIEACLDTAQQMRRLTDALLALARLDSTRQTINREHLSLTECANACVDLVESLAVARGIKINRDLEPAIVLGNADYLNQVITNLLTNAIHYNRPNGEITISTRTEQRTAILEISDTGVGIAPEDVPHIFDRFYRADKSRSNPEGRTGLGLAICKAIIDAHGGTIEVSSDLGSGTKFTVRLPA